MCNYHIPKVTSCWLGLCFLVYLLTPLICIAQSDGIGGGNITLRGIANVINNLFASGLIGIAVALVSLAFFWNLFKFLVPGLEGGDDKNKKVRLVSKKRLLWSIFVLFIVFSLYGFFTLLEALLGR